ncbi:MAG TPA: C-GCAxxG-C-C family protein [Syntrophorhabdales bacterium]|nr:C-GCAxxG-C-C family protein [Syntrophorhabdales bacterium]
MTMDDLPFRMLQLKSDGFCCSQIVLILGLETQGRGGNSSELVRAAGGLCFGLATGEEVCGALSGGVCLLSLYAGKGTKDEQTDERFLPMAKELNQWFREAHGAGSVRCNDILAAHQGKGACGAIVAETFAKVLEILAVHGLDSSKGREG